MDDDDGVGEKIPCFSCIFKCRFRAESHFVLKGHSGQLNMHASWAELFWIFTSTSGSLDSIMTYRNKFKAII